MLTITPCVGMIGKGVSNGQGRFVHDTSKALEKSDVLDTMMVIMSQILTRGDENSRPWWFVASER